MNQEEYLHQTYNSMPDMTEKLNKIIKDADIQWNIYNDSRAEVTRNQPTTPNVTKAVKQFEAMFMYTSRLEWKYVCMSCIQLRLHIYM